MRSGRSYTHKESELANRGFLLLKREAAKSKYSDICKQTKMIKKTQGHVDYYLQNT